MRIAMTGTHGTGKTTLARALAERLKMPLITDCARQVARGMGIEHVSSITADKTRARKFQWSVVHELMRAECNYPAGFVSDRSMLDCLAYWEAYHLGESTGYTCLCLHHHYDLLVYVLPEIPCADDGFRSTDERLRREVDVIIRGLLEYTKTPVVKVTGTVEERLMQVLERLNGGVKTRGHS